MAEDLLDVSENTIIKVGPCTLVEFTVLAGSAPGAFYDIDKIADIADAKRIAIAPTAVGIYELVWPCTTGIVFAPGTGQIVNVTTD